MPIPYALPLLALTALSLAACREDETVGAYGAADIKWSLHEIDGQTFPSTASLQFPEPGHLTGTTPCNTFTAHMDAPYPWFDAQKLRMTEIACDGQRLEMKFIQALQNMTLSEVSGKTLILSNTYGQEMVFTAAD